MYEIQPITECYRRRVNQILKEEWNCPPSVSKGKSIDTTVLPGFLVLDGDSVQGLVTYHTENEECEIVTLNSFEENCGIGTMLVHAVLKAAKQEHCRRLWLITTNDDCNAIRFYQKKGFELAALHKNAMEVSRRIKPAIPLIGMDGIPIRHELEFEMEL